MTCDLLGRLCLSIGDQRLEHLEPRKLLTARPTAEGKQTNHMGFAIFMTMQQLVHFKQIQTVQISSGTTTNSQNDTGAPPLGMRCPGHIYSV